jgi:hypothetical protein
MRMARLMIPCLLLLATTAAAQPFKRRHKRHKKPTPAHKEEAPADDAAVEMEPDAELPAPRAEAERIEAARLDGSGEEPLAEPEQKDEATPQKKTRARQERFYFRAGLSHVEPRISSSGMTLEPEGIARLATPMGPVQGSVKTDPTNVFTAILGYAPRTFRGYVGFETIIGIPKKAKLKATGDLANKSLAPTALDLVPTGIPPLGEELGEASAAPLMLTIVARAPALGPARFYAGGGGSVLFVTDAKVTNPVLTEVATPKLDIAPSLGVVAQAGVDIHIVDRFYARLDFKELWFQPAETRITNIRVKTTIPLLETVNVGSARSESKANPKIFSIGVGASF